MDKHVFIICGISRTGKDTAISFMEKWLESNGVLHSYYSSIEPIKEMLLEAGIADFTSEANRKMLAEIKTAMENNDWLITRTIVDNFYNMFRYNLNVGITQYREVAGIEAFKRIMAEKRPDVKVHVIKVSRKEAEDKCPDNHADKDAFNIEPDHLIINEGSYDDLRESVRNLMVKLIK